jgi:LITAF-like zinc ribbon domain
VPRRYEDDDDDYDRRPARRRNRRYDDDEGFRCPFCGDPDPPLVRTKVSGGGWALFVVMLVLLCWPLCWIPLVAMKDEYRVCQGCGVKLG